MPTQYAVRRDNRRGKVGEMGVHQGIKASLGERCERYNTLQKVCIPIADANSTTMTPNRAPRLSEGGSWQAAPHRPRGGAHAMPCHSGPCNAMPCHSGPCHAMHRPSTQVRAGGQTHEQVHGWVSGDQSKFCFCDVSARGLKFHVARSCLARQLYRASNLCALYRRNHRWPRHGPC